MHLAECREQPARVVVVGNGPAQPVAVVHEIGRVGQDEIYRSHVQACHDLAAVSCQHGVAWGTRNQGLRTGGLEAEAVNEAAHEATSAS